MRILWDCRSVASHMGGIGHACMGWLSEFQHLKPKSWEVIPLLSAVWNHDELFGRFPFLKNCPLIIPVEAGMVDQRFEQLKLPTLLIEHAIDLYFNPCFTIPAVKTSRFQSSVVHDLVFLEHPEWVDQKLAAYLTHGTDLALRRADLVFTVSDFSRSRILASASERGWRVDHGVPVVRPSIPDGTRAAAKANSEDCQASTSPPFLLYLGSVEEKKGMTVLLDALSLLLRDTDTSCPDLVIAGGTGGQAYDLDAQVAKRGLGQHVRCLGPVPNEKKNALLRSATAFVFPSLYEGFGIPPLEAMAFGAPVIAAKSTSLPEVLDDAAIYSEPGDQVSLAEAISRVLGDAELRKELADKGKRRAAESDWTSGAKMLVNSFEKLVDSK